MADQVGKYHDNGTPAYWIEAGTGKPYTMGMVNGQPTGQKVYLSPAAMDPYTSDRGPYQPGMLGGGSQWDTGSGQWDQKSNALEKITLAGAAAPFAAFGLGALGMGGGPSAVMTGPTEAGGSGAAATGAAAGGSGAAGAASSLPKWLGPAAAIGIPAVGRMVSGPGSAPDATGGLSPQIMQLLQEFLRRQQTQGPLADATTHQALAGLPRTT